MRYIFSIIISTVFIVQLTSQTTQYEVSLTPMLTPNLGGIQSYAVGTYQGEWLIIGGRLDGLHRRRPFAAFGADGNNQDVIVVNPTSNRVWRKSLASLPNNLKEQLSSTNMQFCQNEDQLIITGGYGFSATADDHVTYPYLTVVDIPSVIESVKNGELSKSDFHQIEDETFRVTGGRLGMIGDMYYLVGGHNFMGRYNPMGPDHGPGFEQIYTHEIRKFSIDLEDDLAIEIHEPIHDEMHLRRRDYNLVSTFMDGEFGLMIYSGVFQNKANLPWLYPVHITADSYKPLEMFTQLFNHYHCATLPIFNKEQEEMHTLFFGGIAQFYMDDGLLVQDNDVPFVNTITDVSQSQNGSFRETILDVKMPGYLGAGSEFILSPKVPRYGEGILSGDYIGDDFVEVGYIFGGIKSSLPNIFWINDGAESIASSTIYKVSIRKSKSATSYKQGINEEKVMIYPNPGKKLIRMSIELKNPTDVNVAIFDCTGVKIHERVILESETHIGNNLLVLDNVNIGFGEFIYELTFDDKIFKRKVIWSE